MRQNIVAIVGRPNVGKSTLFNRLCRKRFAIVDPTAGVTRDRKYEQVIWNNHSFIVVDTGGIIPSSDMPMDKLIRMQAEIAIQEADLIVFLVDAQTGVVHEDEEIARILYSVKDRVILAVNKCDNEKFELEIYDFLSLGFGDAFPIAAEHGRNTGNFLDLIINHIPDTTVINYDEEKKADTRLKIAVVGRPNVGKSSIINRLLGEDTLIVDNVAGTTRDAIDSTLRWQNQELVLIDTAGLRRRGRVKYGIEYFSAVRTIVAIDRADVVVLVLDATQDLAHQDQKIIHQAHRRFKEIIIIYNKWDLIENKTSNTVKEFEKALRDKFPYLTFAPVMFISALINQRVYKLLDVILQVHEEAQKRIPTRQLNTFLEESIAKYPPSHSTGKMIKIYYCTQSGINPPEFVFFCNNPSLITKNWRRYLHNQLRDQYKFTGSTIKLHFRGRGKNDDELPVLEY